MARASVHHGTEGPQERVSEPLWALVGWMSGGLERQALLQIGYCQRVEQFYDSVSHCHLQGELTRSMVRKPWPLLLAGEMSGRCCGLYKSRFLVWA